ncbi:MAG TPA: alpha/beta hydrolase [Caulobacterales bacterium]|nr:alpha/beta hydrolase [Caulobacterales bacterium]
MPLLHLEDGAKLAYADQGEGAPILLVHGWAAHGGFFDDLRDRLSKTHRVLVPTLRGHPGSERGEAPLTIGALASDLSRLVEALDLHGVVALGWSMGAMALWDAYPRLAKRIDAIIVSDMGPKLLNGEDWRFGLGGGYSAEDAAATLAEIESDWPAYVARFAPRMFAAQTRASRPDLVDWATREMTGADKAAMRDLWASMIEQDFRAALRAIEAPMLVIRGAESSVHPEAAIQFVASAAPRGARVTIPGAGHVPHLEAPELFFEHVEAFARNPRRRDALREGVHP